jgi:hypothetical protein
MTDRMGLQAGGTAAAVKRGLVAGFAAAAVLALWFLVVDTLAGRPFHTPAFLARVLLGADVVALSIPHIALYTVIHFALFLVLGAVVGWLMDRLDAVPGILLGFILGFLLFNLVFYGGVWLTGTDVVNDLGWVAVLVGNVIAGLTLVGVVRLLHPQPGMSLAAALREQRVLREGFVVGLIGAGVVALWFLVLDAAMGRLLFTPAALGSVVFHGASDAAGVRLDALAILGYTGLHLVAFGIAGVGAAAIVAYAEDRRPYVLLGAVLLFVALETLFIGVVTLLAQWLLELIPWWSILVANVAAAAAMGAFLWRQHPALARAVSDPDLERDVERASEAPGATAATRATGSGEPSRPA